jgi:hydrophobic/amphiphilic exporter-1 (mainly G- bacteria), HAE1 family
LLLGLTGCAFLLGTRLPTSFLPEEDQGYIFINAQLPLAASLDRTDEFCKQVEEILRRTPGIQYFTTVIGFSLLSQVQSTYNAFFFVTLKPWDERTRPEEQFGAIQANINQELSRLPAATAFTFPPPSIPGVGTSGGFTFVLEDRSGSSDASFLTHNLDAFMAAARKRPELARLTTTALPNVPQLFVKVDRDKALAQGVSLTEIYRTMQAFMGGYFINYFNRFGRQWQVYVEAEGEYRTKAENLGLFYVRNSRTQSVPLSAVTEVVPRTGPEFIMHFNEYNAAQINGSAAPGYSSAQATRALEQVFAQTMPSQMGFDYLGMSFQEQKAAQGVSASQIFGLSLLFVFLILAALYESWSLPFSVLLSTPVAVFGAFLALFARGSQNNVYVQIGMVMLLGLAAKNAILIVEFAKTEYDRGRTAADAALIGARIRLRPILMTSFAFILGCLPLWFASGSGGVSRQTLGTTVVGGMLGATLLGIFIIPVAFYVVERITARFRRRPAHPPPPQGGASL